MEIGLSCYSDRNWSKEKEKRDAYWIVAVEIEAPLDLPLHELLGGFHEPFESIQHGCDGLHFFFFFYPPAHIGGGEIEAKTKALNDGTRREEETTEGAILGFDLGIRTMGFRRG